MWLWLYNIFTLEVLWKASVKAFWILWGESVVQCKLFLASLASTWEDHGTGFSIHENFWGWFLRDRPGSHDYHCRMPTGELTQSLCARWETVYSRKPFYNLLPIPSIIALGSSRNLSSVTGWAGGPWESESPGTVCLVSQSSWGMLPGKLGEHWASSCLRLFLCFCGRFWLWNHS